MCGGLKVQQVEGYRYHMDDEGKISLDKTFDMFSDITDLLPDTWSGGHINRFLNGWSVVGAQGMFFFDNKRRPLQMDGSEDERQNMYHFLGSRVYAMYVERTYEDQPEPPAGHGRCERCGTVTNQKVGHDLWGVYWICDRCNKHLEVIYQGLPFDAEDVIRDSNEEVICHVVLKAYMEGADVPTSEDSFVKALWSTHG